MEAVFDPEHLTGFSEEEEEEEEASEILKKKKVIMNCLPRRNRVFFPSY